MCTVTIAPLGDRLRLACNRDEAVSRPAARPPRIEMFGDRRAILPIDPSGGGTWVAANDAGLVMALLNASSRRRIRGERILSRGLIIPGLLHCGSLDEALVAARGLDPGAYRPFRLLIADRQACDELSIVKGRLRSRRRTLANGPLMFTSSGLGDHLVDRPRRALFRRMVSSAPRSRLRSRQTLYHRHHWPHRPQLSVDMRRPGACTVSHACVELLEGGVLFEYRAGGPRGRAFRMTLQ